MRPLYFLAIATLLVPPTALSAQAFGQADPAAIQQLLVAEDARGTGREGIRPILAALSHRDPMMRRLGARAAGRLQDPALGNMLVPMLADRSAEVRREAANGIAQSLNNVRRTGAADPSNISVGAASSALMERLDRERDPYVLGALALSLGRLPYGTEFEARAAERAIMEKVIGLPSREVTQGLYRLSMARRTTGPLTATTVTRLRQAVTSSPDPGVRRLALSTLALVAGLDHATIAAALVDRDDQVRRLALDGITNLSAAERPGAVERSASDPSHIVRIAAIGAARVGARAPDCRVIIALLDDPTPLVTVAAANALGSPCADAPSAIAALERVIATAPTAGALDHRWQRGVTALQSLARVAPDRAKLLLPRFIASGRVGERLAAAAAAGTLNDQITLQGLAVDRDHNVQEAAIAALSRTVKHGADSVYVNALASRGYQVVLAAATALAGTTHDGALAGSIAALRRITTEQRETSRDPRVMLLTRIGELGTMANAGLLTTYLTDFDSTVAFTTADLLTKWSGSRVVADPRPLLMPAEPLAQLLLGSEVRLMVTMARSSGGGTFVIRLRTDEAPATAARLLRLASEGFYNGKIIQRVEPNFVTQGGGPDASEYVGDGPFMRDELGLLSHFRGTIGISSRGRDTGDAQLFLNLVDNARLDHEYTVAGEVIRGLEVAEGIMAGDVIAIVEVDGVGAPQRRR